MMVKGSGMLDIVDFFFEEEYYGNYLIYMSFGELGEVFSCIDFFFIKEFWFVMVKMFGVFVNSFDDNICLLDYCVVVVDLSILL